MKTKRAKQTTVNHDKPEEQKHEKKIDNIVRKEGKKRKKMKKVGIDFDFPGYASLVVFFLFDSESSLSTSFSESTITINVPPTFFFFSGCRSESKTC